MISPAGPVARTPSPWAAIVLPALGAVLVAAILLATVLHVSTRKTDELAVARQNYLVRLAVHEGVVKVIDDQASSTVWDDAIVRLRERPIDLGWFDNNVGIWFHTHNHHDEVYMLDPRDRPFYAMQQGHRAVPTSFAEVAPHVLPLVRELRAKIAVTPRVTGHNQGIADFDMIEGRPALVTVRPFVPETDKVQRASGPETLHVSLRYLDRDFLSRLSARFRIQGAHFATEHSGTEGVSLRNRSGRSIGYILWVPYSPGAQVAARMAPAIILTLAIIGALLVWLLNLDLRGRRRLVAAHAESEWLASHDVLTGVSNRACFQSTLDVALDRQQPNQLLAVAFLDLDRFKIVNDAWGHAAGDALICQFCTRLLELLPAGGLVARVGGDEFAVVLEGSTLEQVRAFCEKALEAVRRPFLVGTSQAHVGVSIGVAYSPGPGTTRTEILRKADIALYRAKEEGRNRYRFFSKDMDDSLQLRNLLEADLRTALAEEKGLELHYQPAFDLRSGRIVGFEALLRWHHPTRGPLPPSEFVPIAEDSGLIEGLGKWVLRHACRASIRFPDQFFAINVSPIQFRSADFVESFVATVLEEGADPHRIHLEITERVLLEEDDIVKAALTALRGRGFTIVLDDFGTGYSSLSYLSIFKVDKIKIDQSFVRSLEANVDSTAIISSVLALGHAMGLRVAAEGVESGAQLNLLRAAGCDEVQGYLISEPFAEDRISDFLASRSSVAA